MGLPYSPTSTMERPDAGQGSETRLQGTWLILARIGWVTFTLLVVGLFFASLPAYFAYLHIVNTTFPGGPQLSPSDVHALQAHGLSLDFYAWFSLDLNMIMLLIYVFVALILFWRRSDDLVALLASVTLIVYPLQQSVPVAAPPLVWPWFTDVVGFFGLVCMGFFLYLFPSGRFVPRWMRWFMIGWAVTWAIAIFFPDIPPRYPLFALLLLALIVSQITSQVYCYRRVSTQVQRQQTKWVVFGFALCFGSSALCFALFYAILPVFFHIHFSPLGHMLGLLPSNILLLFFPFFIGIAVLRYHLWDIDVIITRTLVYGTLTVSVIGLYVLVVVGLGSLIQAQGNLLLSLLATGLIAVLFQPARARFQQGVNRLLYGERDEPSRVLTRLGQRLEATLTPDAVLPVIVETVAQALKLPAVAITWTAGEGGAQPHSPVIYGEMKARTAQTRVPLVYQQETVGELVLAPRQPGESLTSADQRLLRQLAPQIGVAVHAVRLTADLKQLTADLQRSRTELVTTREEERRRLRRDLHDGLGSVLASLNWRAGALRAMLVRDPVAADAIVVEQQHTIQTALGDIRRLVYDLRPPALDELGLVGAIREQATKQSTAAERDRSAGLQVEVCVPDALPELPAAVEVAAYRIAQEALTNVAHHAHAHRCTLCLSCTEDHLEVIVTDDGTGLPAGHHVGVGLLSMHGRE